jgi:hypothetical protein
MFGGTWTVSPLCWSDATPKMQRAQSSLWKILTKPTLTASEGYIKNAKGYWRTVKRSEPEGKPSVPEGGLFVSAKTTNSYLNGSFGSVGFAPSRRWSW